MTMERSPNPGTIRAGKGPWLRYAMEAADRWVRLRGTYPAEMQKFGAHIRELRYQADLSLEEMARQTGAPYEALALLEQGLVRPSEIPAPMWSRIARMLDGKGSTLTPMPQPTPRAESQLSGAARHEGPAPIGQVVIKVLGVGGGGSNAVARMYRQRVGAVEYIAVNTDAQHLSRLDVPAKFRIGDKVTRGLGVGGRPEIGREAAIESREQIEQLLHGTDLLFIAAGMGGGTGTGAAPVIAEIARGLNILTIGVVTKPFQFEGRRRAVQAEQGIERLRQFVDTLAIIPNDRLSALSDERMTAENAFRIADDVLRQGVQSVTELVTQAGEINLDFADVKSIVKDAGSAWIAMGHGRGDGRALAAAKAAVASPLLEVPIDGATRVLLNIAGGDNLTLQEVRAVADFIAKVVGPEANIIFGMVTDPSLDDELRVTLIATGLPGHTRQAIQGASLEDVREQALAGEPPAAPPTAEAEPWARQAPAPEPEPFQPPPPPPQSSGGSLLSRFGFGRKKSK
ncbi:MAG: cell division protein FtsZ [SAR202 cluster bacterium]|nr:cell division protein FtsZ [SAR202 cluster bacterium]